MKSEESLDSRYLPNRSNFFKNNLQYELKLEVAVKAKQMLLLCK